MVFFWIFNILELIKRLESSPRLGQVVQECLYLAEKFRSKQYIANSALDTISARLNLAASVSSLASLDSSCITIQVIYHSVRLPTACPYNRQAVPGWTCLPGPIKSSLTSYLFTSCKDRLIDVSPLLLSSHWLLLSILCTSGPPSANLVPIDCFLFNSFRCSASASSAVSTFGGNSPREDAAAKPREMTRKGVERWLEKRKSFR